MASSFLPANDSPEALVDAFEALLDPQLKQHTPDELVAAGGALITRLRALNRESTAAVLSHREISLEARNSMEETHLQLQNLLYEQRHLEREIQKAQQFGFIYQDISLNSLEEFAEAAPELASETDEHQLMKNRLDFEHTQRKRLEEQKKQLIATRDRLLQEKKDLRPRLDTQSREESELSKRADVLDSLLSELTLARGSLTPAAPAVPSLPSIAQPVTD